MNDERIEIAYLVLAGREGRLTWKRTAAARRRLEKVVARLREKGALDVRIAERSPS